MGLVVINDFSTRVNNLVWYKWLETFNDEKDIIRTKNMLIHSVIPFVDTQIKGYKGRESTFI